MHTTNNLLLDYFRCPESSSDLSGTAGDEAPEGFFRFGDDVVCYGRSDSVPVARTVIERLHDALDTVHLESSHCVLPFDPVEMVDNLRRERYVRNAESHSVRWLFQSIIRKAYYGARPRLPVSVRKQFQRLAMAGRTKIPFPNWPVDRTVDRFLERLLALSMKARGIERTPFIWFWPDGQSGATILTHDVETTAGVQFCPKLMDIDEEYGIRSSFQFIPEDRYPTPESLIDEMRQRGFEINIHDLNHDGRLYWNRKEFLRRATKINRYVQKYDAKGFRSGALYRNVEWYDAFEFSYDMSVPNVGHLNAQLGGCCTVMPYFVGSILELPLTTTEDYPLFQIFDEYSIELWMRQINMIHDGHGLMSFITHPDYLVERRARAMYRALLDYLSSLHSKAGLWIALPGQVDEWWRARNQMQILQHDSEWRIEGPGSERARLAYATLDGDSVRITIEEGLSGKDSAQPIHSSPSNSSRNER